MSRSLAMRRSMFMFALGTAACCLVSACNPNGPYVPIPETGASLKGTVIYKKQPLTAGVVFASGSGGGVDALIDPDGRYTLLNVPVGEVTIGVSTEKLKSMMMNQAMTEAMSKRMAKGKDAKGGMDGSPPPAPKIVDVPKVYGHPATSPLKTTIQSGENTFDIVIE
jgi:hypothetical protein